jgi:hypothetical protein
MECSFCHAPVTLLENLSAVSLMDFYQCEACGRLSERLRNSDASPVSDALASIEGDTMPSRIVPLPADHPLRTTKNRG